MGLGYICERAIAGEFRGSFMFGRGNCHYRSHYDVGGCPGVSKAADTNRSRDGHDHRLGKRNP